MVAVFYILEQQRQNDRELRKAGRDLERDKVALEREEKKIVSIYLSSILCIFVWSKTYRLTQLYELTIITYSLSLF